MIEYFLVFLCDDMSHPNKNAETYGCMPKDNFIEHLLECIVECRRVLRTF